MCDVNDVIKNSTKSAAEIVSTLYEYGENSLQAGLCKLAHEKYVTGYQAGINAGIPKGFLMGVGVSVIGVTTYKIHKFVQKRKANVKDRR